MRSLSILAAAMTLCAMALCACGTDLDGDSKQNPISAPDGYSCTVDSDCEIKNVGNCCGYYPRCVNTSFQPTAPKCEDGLGGVCGYPEISHCLCREDRCVSMQGDDEV